MTTARVSTEDRKEGENLTQSRKAAKGSQTIRMAAKRRKRHRKTITADERRYTQIGMTQSALREFFSFFR
jgi:translation initiation factor 1 (eIF-1/SUI1)